ncbi:hypothetical protein HGM15179_018906 [Zosterops borbonicus]|uniref:Uncharacterized protein n=1 Tax=Zosterops borbonicus TaxID=364589 RepID=A0A8K1DBD3_9PASS|nr:hypothetical protein HGM15179_018906 [Zosterops borbonicus]
MLPSWRVTFETLKAQENSQDTGNSCSSTADSQCSLRTEETAAKVKQTATSPSCAVESESNKSLTEETVSPSPTLQQTLSIAPAPAIAETGEGGPPCSVRVFAANYDSKESDQDGLKEDPFDPGPIDPDKEPDLYSPNPHDNWVRLKRQALKEGDFEIAERIVASVIYKRSRGQNAQWEQLSFLEIKELRQAATERGIGSPHFVSLLDSVFAAHTMTPYDLKTLARLLLSPMQYSLWEKEWERGLQNLLLTYIGHADQALATLIIRQLIGTGPYTDPAVQAQECPKEALDGAQNAARQAFSKVPDAKTLEKAFTTIVQGPQEPYMQFVDSLKQALECQIDNADACEILEVQQFAIAVASQATLKKTALLRRKLS